jgi:hypothetical protein
MEAAFAGRSRAIGKSIENPEYFFEAGQGYPPLECSGWEQARVN